MQELTWDVPGGIAASESTLVEVYDWDAIGKHKYYIYYYCKQEYNILLLQARVTYKQL